MANTEGKSGTSLGKWLRDRREQAGLKQDQVAALVAAHDATASTGLTQSAIARLEAGTVQPRWDVLLQLAETYGVRTQEMAAKFLSETFFRGGRDFFVSNAVNALTLDEIATWEQNLTSQGREVSLWIVAPDFVDDEDDAFLGTVVDCFVAKKADITYFVDEKDTLPGERFDLFLDRVVRRLSTEHTSLLKQPNKLGRIGCYGLTKTERAWLTSSFAIANPDSNSPIGYTIVSVDGRPRFGIPLPATDVRRMAWHIRQQVEARRGHPNKRGGYWEPSALTSSEFFKKACRRVEADKRTASKRNVH